MKSLQIRNVPDRTHRRLKARAALLGMSLSEYVLLELRRALERPTREELLERIERMSGIDLHDPSPAEVVRQERERR